MSPSPKCLRFLLAWRGWQWWTPVPPRPTNGQKQPWLHKGPAEVTMASQWLKLSSQLSENKKLRSSMDFEIVMDVQLWCQQCWRKDWKDCKYQISHKSGIICGVKFVRHGGRKWSHFYILTTCPTKMMTIRFSKGQNSQQIFDCRVAEGLSVVQ